MIKEDLVMLDLNNFMIQGWKRIILNIIFCGPILKTWLSYRRFHSFKYKTCKEKERESEKENRKINVLPNKNNKYASM